jgi:aspartyl-tRNA(Asn)/glutamyl-tRNA(Gln) amidotransferase subunit A
LASGSCTSGCPRSHPSFPGASGQQRIRTGGIAARPEVGADKRRLSGIFITELEPGDGIRLAVKDMFDTAGVRTTYGSAVFADHVPSESAAAVRLLEGAGYANVGKTNLHEFAYGVTSQNLHYGTVPNPSFPGRTAGGSSGGSAAALVAGLADAALGTDSGGSIRIPAACCAIVGFKPSYGLISTDGVFPLAPSYDHVGPMARDVATCIELMRVLAGLEAEESRPLRVGVAWTGEAEPLVRERVTAAAALLDAAPVAFPLPEGTTPLFMHEVGAIHRELYAEHGELYGENLRPKIVRCLEVTDAEAAVASSARSEYERQAFAALEGLDLLVTPTLGFVPPPADIDEIATRASIVRLTYPFNLLGWPVLALPCGLAEDGLPASAQLVGRPGSDGLVLAAGARLEAALKT